MPLHSSCLELSISNSFKKKDTIPDETTLSHWVNTILHHENRPTDYVSIRMVDEPEGQKLNQTYRHKNYATNVLSFPYIHDNDFIAVSPPLGDIALCVPVIEREAQENQLDLTKHYAHLVIHGILHVIGYDHQNNEQARIMEQLETKLLKQLGFCVLAQADI